MVDYILIGFTIWFIIGLYGWWAEKQTDPYEHKYRFFNPKRAITIEIIMAFISGFYGLYLWYLIIKAELNDWDEDCL